MKIQTYGDSALIIKFEDEISLEISRKVISLYQNLEKTQQFQFIIPAYNSITVGLDKRKTSFKEATSLIEETATQALPDSQVTKHLMIPVCYEQEYAVDLPEVEKCTGLSADEIIELHCSQSYHVYMLGFIAGFPYLGALPKALETPRRAEPRLKVPAGAVGLAGRQTGIYPTQAPGGWQLIGQTPVSLFDPKSDTPSTLMPGDRVRFRAISQDEFKLIKIKVETSIYEPEFFNG